MDDKKLAKNYLKMTKKWFYACSVFLIQGKILGNPIDRRRGGKNYSADPHLIHHLDGRSYDVNDNDNIGDENDVNEHHTTVRQ